MRDWALQPGDPLSLILSADARLANLDYTNDQIWELLLGSGDPAAIMLQTTYGLRARNMRIFFRFGEGGIIVSDPSLFYRKATIKRFYPNYILMVFSPFEDIDVTAEFWVPGSQILAGRIQITNNGDMPREPLVELVALLNPAKGGEAIVPKKHEGANILQGKTEGLSPVVFITGGPEGRTSPYPSLANKFELLPGQSRRLTWVHAAVPEMEEGFEIARSTAARRWDAEISRIEMQNSSRLDITTGNPDWDAVFAFGQKSALNLIHSPSDELPHASFVETRQPDQGYSPNGDGRDYNHLWNGQSALDAWYLSGLLLPSEPEIAKGLLLNFLSTQDEKGRIDLKPGLAGQRSNMLSTPILASLAWRIYLHTEDLDFLKNVFSSLLDFLHAWFSKSQDRDRDGIPEWDNPVQTGFEENPTFARWHTWAKGADITLYESPALCAFLYRECKILVQIAELLGRSQATLALDAITGNLLSAVEKSWDGRAATYRYWDYETHASQRGELLGKRVGPGEIYLDTVFDYPSRILIRIETGGDSTLNARVFIHGAASSGKHRVERIGRRSIQWYLGLGTATVKRLYSELERMQVEGIPADGIVSIYLVDHYSRDQSLLLPLWARIPDKIIADNIIERSVTNPKRYWHTYGIPAVPFSAKSKKSNFREVVWNPWNVMIAEGMLAYGGRQEAADLVKKMMDGGIRLLKTEGGFRKHIHADSGEGIGESNALAGLPPMGLFMDTLGVRIISPWRVRLEGSNPYPWPVVIKFRGLKIERTGDLTAITFPDGESVVVDDPAGLIVDGRGKD